MVDQLSNLRPIAVLYSWTVAAAFLATGSSNLHPLFGRLWDVAAAAAGAFAALALPLSQTAKWRSTLVTVIAFTALAHAVEWMRLTNGSPVGISVALLWVAVLTATIATAGADQETPVRDKLPPLT